MLPYGVVRLAGRIEPWERGRHDDAPTSYHGFRFPAEVIEHVVWLYHCFSLSLRDHPGRPRRGRIR
jgi:hypothetical protein